MVPWSGGQLAVIDGEPLNEILPIVQCPACKGTRKDFSPVHKRPAICEWCRGAGWLRHEVCRGCGKPATRFWPPKQTAFIRYCGAAECLTVLVTIHKPEVKLLPQPKLSQLAIVRMMNARERL